MVEGFDSGHITAPRKDGGENTINSFFISVKNGSTPLKYKLEDYDVIYVDFGIGTTYIQNNAELLKKAIRWVNQHKVGTEKNIVLGQSMGGLVARYALKDMEDKGENHDTKLFISHDSPYLGANTPLGVQYMLRNMSKTFLKSPIVAGINYVVSPVIFGVPVSEVFTVADTPASRQMLINYVDKNYNIDNSVHNAWQATLKAKGYPQKTRNVAISNGSECGTDQNIQDLVTMHATSKGWFIDPVGILLGGLQIDLGQIILSALPGRSRYHYDFVVRPMTKLNENKELYNGKIVYRKDILWFIKAQNTLLSGSNYQPRGILSIDKYGGGKFKFPKIALPKFIKGDFNTNYFSFVPTPSALDYKKGNKILTEEDYQKSFSPVDDINDTPFANFVAERVVNSEEFDHENKNNNFHINFSDRNGQFIINQLSEDPVLQDKKLTASYLCGSKIKIGGEDIQCENKNAVYTTGFAPYIYWSVNKGSNLIDITSPTNQPQISFTPKPRVSGLVELQARLYGDNESNTIKKRIWIGNPRITIVDEPDNTNYVTYNVESLDREASLEDQGLTSENVIWKRMDTGAMRYGYDYFTIFPNYNSKGFRVEVEATNKCGKDFEATHIHPTKKRCNDFYMITKVRGNDYTVSRRIIDDPHCPIDRNPFPYMRGSNINRTNAVDTDYNYYIIVTNSLGNIIINKRGKDFSLSSVPMGSYFVKIVKDGKIIASQTLIKK